MLAWDGRADLLFARSVPLSQQPNARPSASGTATATPPSGYEREALSPTPEQGVVSAPECSAFEPRGRRGHVPALDGVRGIAILAVFLFHCSLRLQGFWGAFGRWGWMGVDLFFVLSGFLITGILLDTRDAAPGSYYGSFYGRRVLRIGPAFVVVMAALVLAPALTGQSAADHLRLVSHEVWYWTFLANVLIATHGWRGVIPQTSPFWSLAVEEQFYLIWPSVVRRLSVHGVLRLGLVLIVVVAILRFVLALRDVSGNALYALMPTRADLLGWGIVLAALVRIPNGTSLIRRLLWPALVGGSLVLFAVVVRERSIAFSTRTMVVAGFPAIALLAACLVAIALVHEPRLLRWPWLTGLGKVSYGLYLWHMTAIVVVAKLLPQVNAWLIPVAFLCSLVPTLVSWFLIEQPALSLKRYTPVRPQLRH